MLMTIIIHIFHKATYLAFVNSEKNKVLTNFTCENSLKQLKTSGQSDRNYAFHSNL